MKKRYIAAILLMVVGLACVLYARNHQLSFEDEFEMVWGYDGPRGSYPVVVNGRSLVWDWDIYLSKQEECGEIIAAQLEGKLNQYSSLNINNRWISLYDKHGTKVFTARAGNDPFEFFPELPAMHFDNRGNLISWVTCDTDEGYFVYTFLYDREDRIIFAQEQAHEVPEREGKGVYYYSKVNIQWRYKTDGSYMTVVRFWNGPDIDKNFVWVEYSAYDADNNRVYSDWFNTESEFKQNEFIQNEWEGAEG